MKRAILGFLAIIFLAGNVYAADITTATFGDQNSSKEYRMKAMIDSSTGNGTVVFASDTGIQYPFEHYTTQGANTLLDYESGKVITDMGGASGPTQTGSCSKHTLPVAEAGLEFTLTAGSKCTTTLDVSSTDDTILYSISGTGLDAGDSIKSTGQAGDSVTLFSTATGSWSIKSMVGIWTDNSTN